MSITREMKAPFAYELYDKFEEKTSFLYWPMKFLSGNLLFSGGEEIPPEIALTHTSFHYLPSSVTRVKVGVMEFPQLKFCLRLRSSSIKKSTPLYLLDYFLTDSDWF